MFYSSKRKITGLLIPGCVVNVRLGFLHRVRSMRGNIFPVYIKKCRQCSSSNWDIDHGPDALGGGGVMVTMAYKQIQTNKYTLGEEKQWRQ